MKSSTQAIIGVLGGMGPAATVDFLQRIVELTPAACDQDHLPLMVSSIPQIPDRTAAFLGCGDSPLDALIAHGRRLVRAGARLIVMPCNTAHLWFEPLQEALATPMLHIVDAALSELKPDPNGMVHVGLLATEATIRSGIYVERNESPIEQRTIAWQLPGAEEIACWIMPAIGAVKAGNARLGGEYLALAAKALVDRGARQIILGCTEIPLALDHQRIDVPLINANEALAKRTVAWGRDWLTFGSKNSGAEGFSIRNIDGLQKVGRNVLENCSDRNGACGSI